MQGVLELSSLPKGDVTQRAIWWSFEITRLLMEDNVLMMSLPDDASLIVMPSDDPELCSHNFNLARKTKSPHVLVQLDRVDDKLVLTPYIQHEAHTFIVNA
jgi:hypothetical protein